MEPVTREEFESFETLVFEMEKRISDLENKTNKSNLLQTIRVEYDGKYPNMCSGTLKIWVNEVIYEKKGVCESTGTCAFKKGKGKITKGRLVWRESEARCWPTLQRAVEEELERFEVCCGGCL
jgi:hypothetical protein